MRKATIHFRPQPTTRLPLDGISLHLVFEYFFENLSRKFKFHYNMTKITGTSHEDRYVLLIASRSVSLRMRNISHRRRTVNQNTHYNDKETRCEDVEGMEMAHIGISGGLS